MGIGAGGESKIYRVLVGWLTGLPGERVGAGICTAGACTGCAWTGCCAACRSCCGVTAGWA
jgi:hypothetical protein